jgi:hypothetical protein
MQTHQSINEKPGAVQDDPLKTIETFIRPFDLNEDKRKTVQWTLPNRTSVSMFAVINAYGSDLVLRGFLRNQATIAEDWR